VSSHPNLLELIGGFTPRIHTPAEARRIPSVNFDLQIYLSNGCANMCDGLPLRQCTACPRAPPTASNSLVL